MFSLQKETNLALLLKALAESEREIEIAKQTLAEEKGFEPYTAFKRIDCLGLSYLGVTELKQFLKENGVYPLDEEIIYLIKRYDTNGDLRISYTNFADAILPATDPTLRQLATHRESYYVGKYEALPYDVERLLSQLFEKEINAFRRIEILKRNVIERYDFELRDAFEAVDADKLGFLDHESFHLFFKRNNMSVSVDDVLALFRRIDKDKDGKISFAEFADIIRPTSQELRKFESYREKFYQSSSLRLSPRFRTEQSPRLSESQSFSKSRTLRDLDYYDYLDRPAFRSPRRSSPYSPRRSQQLAHSLPIEDKTRLPSPRQRETSFKQLLAEKSPDRLSYSQTGWSTWRSPRIDKIDDGYSTPRRSSRSPNPRSERISPLKESEEEQLAKALKIQMELDTDIECLKNDLALKSDFNLLDIFRIFDIREQGYITIGDFERVLREFNVFPSLEKLKLVFRRFDKDDDEVLR